MVRNMQNPLISTFFSQKSMQDFFGASSKFGKFILVILKSLYPGGMLNLFLVEGSKILRKDE